MGNKLIGVIFLCVSALLAVIGTIGAQIAYAIVLSGFYTAKLTGEVPSGPGAAEPHWIVIVSVIALASFGLFFLFRGGKSD
jgi:hypothetical protein